MKPLTGADNKAPRYLNRAFRLSLLRCYTHVSEEENLHRFQQGLWDEVKL